MADILSYENKVLSVAWKMTNEERHDEALKIYQRLSKKNSKSVRLLFAQGYCHGELHNFYKSIYFYQQVQKLEPKHYGSWNNMGLCYGELGKWKAAIRKYQTAIEIQIAEKLPYTEAFENLVLSFQEKEMWREVLQTLDQWIKVLGTESAILMKRYLLKGQNIAFVGGFKKPNQQTIVQ